MAEMREVDKFLDYQDFGGGYNTRDADINVADNELTGGQNIDLNFDKSITKRKGHSLYGNYLGPTTKILGLFTHEPAGGTTELLSVFNTNVYRYVAGVWTALTGGATLTTNLPADAAYFPLTRKTYISNGTDSVQVYTSGTSIASDASFKKGKYLAHYKNRILAANVATQTDYVWYSDLGVDTFSANNYIRCGGEVTGLEVLFERLLTFTKKRVYVVQNFTFSGSAAGPESFLPLRSDFGAIYDRSIAKVNNLVYFLGQDSEGVASVYATDGLNVFIVSDKISNDLNNLAPASLVNSCATPWGRFYRLSVTQTGDTVNTKEYLYDTVSQRWLPPYTNGLGGFSCYTTLESSGQLDVYAGSQTEGAVYKLNQEDHDESPSERYTLVGNNYDAAVDANPSKRAAQSFKLTDFTTAQSVPLDTLFLKIKKNAGTTTELTVRIETDNNGNPSGTLAAAEATTTIGAITSTTYAYAAAVFTDLELTGDTTYWVVLQHTTEGSGDSQYYWGGDDSSPTYTHGNASLYVDSTSGTQTFTPDADTESTSVDGYVQRSTGGGGTAETYSTIRDGAGTSANSSGPTGTVSLVGGDETEKWFTHNRGVVLFDTSNLPDDAVITSATLSLYITYTDATISDSIGITASNPASDTALAAADYDVTDFGSTRFATDQTISSLTTNAYNTFTLNNDGEAAIDPEGITKFAIRLASDIDDTSPTWAVFPATAQVNFATADSANKPRLVVAYTSAAGSAIWTSDADIDLNFIVFTEGDIDGYADTKAFFLAPQGQKAHLRDIFITAKADGNYNLNVGINTGTYSGFDTADVSLSSGGAVFGTTFTFGTSVLGGTNRAESRLRSAGFRARTVKFRFRNQFAAQPFTVYAFRARYQPINKFK